MPKFLPLDGILDRPLVLPYGGKEYRFQPLTGEVVIYLTTVQHVGNLEAAGEEVPQALRDDLEALQDADPRPLAEKVLGPTVEELRADKVPSIVERHMLRTVAQWALSDENEEYAALIWSLPTLTDEPTGDDAEEISAPKA